MMARSTDERSTHDGSPLGALNAASRSRDLNFLGAGGVVDVLVVGGGITGVGAALDAASRGLSVALVEKGDLASGTSRWSSKLVHGGLRYLASLQLSIAAESARERHLLATTIAPHLLRPIPFLVPVGSDRGQAGRLEALATRTGMTLADGLRAWSGTPSQLIPPTRRVSVDEAVAMVPALRREGLQGGLSSWDLRLEDDARLVVAVARTAASLGARVLTRVRAEVVGPGGAVVTDELTGSSVEIRARHVINAAGVWAGTLTESVALRPSRGTHVVLPASALGYPTAQLTVSRSFGRAVFAPPRPDGTIIVGLTDERHDGSLDTLVPSESEIDLLLEIISRPLRRPLDRDDVIGAFTGLRPLLDSSEGSTADMSREHTIATRDGVTTVVGGKLTTYRKMAQDALDEVTDRPCVTASLPLLGAVGMDRGPNLPERLVRRFGGEAVDVAAMAEGRPELLRPLAPDVPALAVEVLWAIAREGALDVDDVLDGRLRLDLMPARRAAALPRAAELVAEATSVWSR